jgi:hypothetical protein
MPIVVALIGIHLHGQCPRRPDRQCLLSGALGPAFFLQVSHLPRVSCHECRALSAPDLSRGCELVASLRESVEERVQIRRVIVAQGRKNTAAWMVLGIVAPNLAGGVFLVRNRASASSAVREAFNDSEPVALPVEANRDASHKAPASLDNMNPPPPSAIAERGGGGGIRYLPTHGGSTFTVEPCSALTSRLRATAPGKRR